MQGTMRRFVCVVGLGLAMGLTAGCANESAKKAKECEAKAEEMADSEACKQCCEDAGAAGHSYVNLDKAECKCL